MLVYRQWKRVKDPFNSLLRKESNWCGWFLFGFIPLWIKQLTPWKGATT